MKLLSFFLLAASLAISAKPVAQTISLSGKNLPFDRIFPVVEKQTGYFFFTSRQLSSEFIPVTVSVKEMPLTNFLDLIFVHQPLGFRLDGKTIFLFEKEAPLPRIAVSDQLAIGPITGQFLDIESNEPVSGASVSVRNAKLGSSSNASGHFSLAGFAGDAVFRISHVGYMPFEIAYKRLDALATGETLAVGGSQVVKTGPESFTIYLSRSENKLDDIVVTAVGIKRSEKALGYSISTVGGDKLDNPQVNVFSSLQGKTTGVNITNISDNPGSSVLMNIRGATSLNIRNSSQSSQPLFVIDGIPVNSTLNFINQVDVGNTISNINPNDIASITVLKGASAAALYGSDAGNGVVMITTKTGASKKGLGVDYSLSTLANTPFKTIKTQKEFAGGDRDIYKYTSVGDGFGPSLYDGVKGQRWNMETQQWDSSVSLSSAGEDRLKAFMRTGMTITNNVAVTGGGKDGSFRASFNNLMNNGVMPNTALYRNTLSFAGTRNLTDRLKVSVSGTYMHSFSPNQMATSGSTGDGNVIARLYNIANQVQPIADMKQYWLKGQEGISPNPIMFDGSKASTENPYWFANESINTITKDWVFGKAQVDWKIAKPLSVMVRTGIDLNTLNDISRMAWGYTGNPNGNYQMNATRNLITNTDVIVSFTKQIRKFSLDANVGYNYQYTDADAATMSASALSRPNDYSIANGKPGTVSQSSNWTKTKKQSLYATAQIGYKGMGYVEATGRKDWGGILEEDKNSYFYPSASISLIPTTIFRLPQVFDFIKLRFGIAQVGHGLGRPRSVDSYSFAANSWNGAQLVNISGNLVDAHLLDEVTNSWEYGTEFRLLDNRITADFTIFKKSHLNQLLNISVPPSDGFSSMTANVGDVVSKGYEWSLNFNPVRTKDINWNFSVNYSAAKATISRLVSGFGDFQLMGIEGYLDYKLAKGETIGNMYQKYDPVFVQSGKYKGSYLIRWAAGDGFERSTDGGVKKKIGNFNPDFIMGFSTNFSYKNWNLNVVANLRYGGQYLSETMAELGSSGFLPESLKGGTKYSKGWVGGRNAKYGGAAWLPAGSGTNNVVNQRISDLRREIDDAVYLKGVYVDPNSGLNYDNANAGDANYIVNGADPRSTLWSTPATAAYDWMYKFASNSVLNATNLKIKEITLTYSFDRALVTKMKLQNLSLSLIGQNVFHWYASGYNEDPETAFTVKSGNFNQGLSRYNMPPIASWGVRLNVGF